MLGAPVKASVFIKIEESRDVDRILSVIKEKILNIETALVRIKEIKTKEDSELVEWKNSLKNAKAKIALIDKNLLEPEMQ
jgi:hypothetical protein